MSKLRHGAILASTAVILGVGASDALAPGPPHPPPPAKIAVSARPRPVAAPAATPETRGSRGWTAAILLIIAAQAAGRAPGASFPK